MASSSGKPNTTANAPLPIADSTANITATNPARATTTAASSSAKPSSGSRRPRILVHVSPMVIVEPNTARPTMTVSIPDSSLLSSQVTIRLADVDAINAPTTPQVSSSGRSVVTLP